MKNRRPHARDHINDPRYIARLIDGTGLGRVELAGRLGCSDRTLQMWTSGTRAMPYVAQWTLECLQANGELPVRPEDAHGAQLIDMADRV